MEKTMKFLSMAALALMGAVMTGCSSDSDELFSEPQQPENKDKVEILTTTVSFGDGVAATRALTEGGVKTFAAGDQIAVVYENTSGTTVKATSVALAAGDITNGGKSANFTVTVTNANKTAPVKYIYPASIAKDNGDVNYDALATQDGTQATIASSLDACEGSDSWNGGNLPGITLDNLFTLCKFTIKESAGNSDITSSVTRLTVKNGSDIYTVNTSSLSNIWVAMKPVTTGDITVYAAKGKDLYKKTVSGKALDAGNLYPINVTTTKIEGAVSGLFLVNGNLVYFSKGNLQATYNGSDWNWAFATNQYDRIGNATANTSINGNGTVSANGTVDLFGWVGASSSWTGAAQYGISNSTETGETENYGNKAGVDGETLKSDWGNTIGGGWRTPTNDEWSSIFSNHTYGMANIGGVKGIIILPYNSSETIKTNHDSYGNNAKTTEQWAALEAAGAVFLPAAGYRSGATVNCATGNYPEGFYWSATPEPDNKNNALYMYMRYNLLSCGNNLNRCNGYSVRLIGE